jgi:hypothetical protein
MYQFDLQFRRDVSATLEAAIIPGDWKWNSSAVKIFALDPIKNEQNRGYWLI